MEKERRNNRCFPEPSQVCKLVSCDWDRWENHCQSKYFCCQGLSDAPKIDTDWVQIMIGGPIHPRNVIAHKTDTKFTFNIKVETIYKGPLIKTLFKAPFSERNFKKWLQHIGLIWSTHFARTSKRHSWHFFYVRNRLYNIRILILYI